MWLQCLTLQGRFPMRWMADQLIFQVKPQTERQTVNSTSIKIHTVITHWPLWTLDCLVSMWAVRKGAMAEIWPPSRCLHSPDTEEDEEGQEERGRLEERITCSCSAVTQSPPRPRASGHRDNIMAYIRAWSSFFERYLCVLCVDERGADTGDLHNMFKAYCHRLAFVSIHSDRTLQALNAPQQLVRWD